MWTFEITEDIIARWDIGIVAINHSCLDLTGYTGYIPGKHPANVFGSTYADSNSTAMEVDCQ